MIEAPTLQILLAIENKVGALEGRDQLRRYADWLARRKIYPPEGKALIYLTPDGRTSNTHGGVLYYRLSYRKNIAEWLEGSLSNIEAPRVREVVAQYVETVKGL